MSTLQTIGIVVGMITGVSGFVLGVINCRRMRNAARASLVVRPRVKRVVDPHKQTEGYVGFMEVHNKGGKSAIDWTIGFLPRRRQDKEIVLNPEMQIAEIHLLDELEPQRRAEPHFRLEDLPDTNELGRAFARTKVGDTFKASRRDMRQFARQRNETST